MASAIAGSPAKGQGVDLGSLSAQQLMQVKKQLDDELEHLNASFNQLRAAQAKFAECLKSIETGVISRDEGAPLLVPLTTSLYVPGELASKDRVIVDVGTGFYIEKSTSDGKKFYTGKIEELSKNLKSLEGVLVQKGNNLRTVEEVLRQKMAEAPAGDPPGSAS